MGGQRGWRRRGAQERAAEKNPVMGSGRQIKLDEATLALSRSLSQREDWQDLAWEGLSVGEFAYAVDFFSNVLSRVRLVAALTPDTPDEMPEPTTDAVAIDTLNRLAAGRAGHGPLLRELAVQFEIPGDCFLVGIAEREEVRDEFGQLLVAARPETWEIRSIDEVVKRDGKVYVIDVPNQVLDSAVVLQSPSDTQSGDFLGRLWLSDPRFHGLATSSARGVLDVLELLSLIQRSYRSIMRQRLSRAAMVAIPLDHSDGIPDPTRGQPEKGEAKQDPLTRDLHAHFVKPVSDESAPGSVAPFIYRYPRSATMQDHGIAKIDLSSPLEEWLPKLEEAEVRRLAQGINAPVELIFGVSQAKFWGGGAVRKSIFGEHVEPRLVTMVNSLTEAYYRPALEAVGATPQEAARFMIWYDASAVVANDDQQEVSLELLKAGAIGYEPLRRVNNFREDDAPTPEDLELLRSLIPTAAGSIPAAEITASSPRETIVAASSRGRGRTLGQRLSDIDVALLVALHSSADAAMRRALERAGARVATLARKDKGLTASLLGAPRSEIVSRVGSSGLAVLGSSTDDLLMGAFDDHLAEFRRRCIAAGREALGLVPNMTPKLRHEAESVQRADIEEAAVWYAQSLLDVAAELLFDPNPPAPEIGEHEEGSLVPVGVVREARARAGGALRQPITAGLADRIAGWIGGLGVATGSFISELMTEIGGRGLPDYTWIYGPSTRTPFGPHLDLDGVTIQSFPDDQLLNVEAWPPVEYLHPGDHLGCWCSFSPDFPPIEDGAETAASVVLPAKVLVQTATDNRR